MNDEATDVVDDQTNDTDQATDTGTISGDTAAKTDNSGPDLASLRQSLSAGDEGFAKQLDRYTSIEAMGKAWKSAVETAQKKQAPLTLPDDATDEQVAEFRKTLGLPEEAKDYPVSFAEGYEAGEADEALLGSFKEMLHAKGGDPRTAGIAMEWYQDLTATMEQDRNARMAEVRAATQQELRAEYGTEYEGNIAAAKELMRTQIGNEGTDAMMQLRLEDGSMLQDSPEFVKMMVQMGVDYYGSNGIINGDVETTAKTIDEKIAEFRDMQMKDPDKYHSDAVQAEVAALYAQKAKLDKRKS